MIYPRSQNRDLGHPSFLACAKWGPLLEHPGFLARAKWGPMLAELVVASWAGPDLCLLVSVCRFFQETHDRFDPQFEVLQVELLVGGVNVVVGQAEAHHHAGHAEMAVEVADDGDGAAGADKDRVLAPDLVQRARGRLDVGIVDAESGRDRRSESAALRHPRRRERSSPHSSCTGQKTWPVSCPEPGAWRPWRAPWRGLRSLRQRR